VHDTSMITDYIPYYYYTIKLHCSSYTTATVGRQED